MILKVDRFKSVHRYDLFLVFLTMVNVLSPFLITLKGP